MSNGRAQRTGTAAWSADRGILGYMAFEAYHTAKRRQQGQPVDEFSSLIPMRAGRSRFPVAPVVLIALGVIFLLDNLDLLDLCARCVIGRCADRAGRLHAVSADDSE